MGEINYQQILVFLLQGTLVSILLLVLFRLRKALGIGLLFAALGLFQFMQVFLSSTVYVAITPEIIISPGSVVLFTATLFSILLIYIREDATETRKIIYALLIVNIVMSILLQSFRWNIEDVTFLNPFNVSVKLFDNNAWVLFVGTVTLFIDALLLIVLFEYISKHITNIFFRVCLTMLLVVTFDTVCFSLAAFWNYDNLWTILYSGIISKGFAAVFYSLILSFYLKFFENNKLEKHDFILGDIFHTLSYRQKFEQVKDEKMLMERKSAQEIRQRETKFQNLTNSSPVGIFLTRSDGYTTYVNPKWCTISGITHDEAIGYGWLNAVHPEDKMKIEAKWGNSVENSNDSYAQYRFLHSDGSIRWVLGQAVPEFDNENQITGYIGTITDITNIKLFEQEINRLKEKAEESDRLKSAFLANMSHEIRTPMNGILGFSELLREPELSGEMRDEFIELINQSGARMLNIINDIIDISKIEAGLMNVSPVETNIVEIIDFVGNFSKPETDKNGLHYLSTVNLASNQEIVLTDKEKVISILTNLVKNAIKFTKQGTISLTCDLESVNETPELIFRVKDTGIGIPQERQAAIFDRFVQADISDKQAVQGAGLGLSISKAYAEMLNGSITVESSVGKGSTFCFRLPVRSDSSIQHISGNTDSKVPQVYSKIKLLIVEDDENSDILISTFMKSYCSDILHAKNAAEAIELSLDHSDIDLILMDIKLPVMTGDEAAVQIRKFRPGIIIIAQTAFAMEHEKTKYSLIFDDYLTKPIVRERLLNSVNKHFKLR